MERRPLAPRVKSAAATASSAVSTLTDMSSIRLDPLLMGFLFIVYNNTDPTFRADGSSVGNGGTAAPVTPLGPIPANYVGCYTDSGTRTLSGTQFTADNMTAAVCASLCASGSGYAYYGTEYSSQACQHPSISSLPLALTETVLLRQRHRNRRHPPLRDLQPDQLLSL